LNTSLELLPI